ncbi:ATP-binding protein [Kineococcus sp. SYSU DK006]|uniref:ATP-binding protein n=1 Tax=Kineococcus sp. SYSU DK006 TaxID=3383127 RepID=UPI003D7D4E0F
MAHVHRPDGPVALVGRDVELAQLGALTTAARAGHGGGLLVQGQAGIGKTALVDAGADAAEAAGLHVLRCRGFRGEGDVGFAGLHELLHPLLDRRDVLPARQRAALEVVFGLADGVPADRLVLGLATLGLLEEVAQQTPVLVLVEDLQWLDPSSAETVAFLPRRVAESRVLVLATTRVGDGERSSWARSFPHVLSLTPLQESDAETLVRATGADLPAKVRTRILRESSGNPLALTELVAQHSRSGGQSRGAAPAALPRRLEDAFLGEALLLPAATRQALLVAATAEGAPQQEVLQAVRSLGLSDADLLPAQRSRLLQPSGDRFAFRHPLISSALYDSAGSSARAQVHGALAAVTRDPARAAQHRAAAAMGWDEDAAEGLDGVAQRALGRGAAAEAATAWRRAAALTAELDRRAGLLASAAEAARQAGASADAAVLLTEVRAVTAPTQHRTLRRAARTDWLLSMTADHQGRGAVDLVDLAAAMPGSDERIEVLAWAATKCSVLQEPEDVRAVVRAALREQDTDRPLQRVALALVDPGAPLDPATFERFRAQAQQTDGVLLNCLAFSVEDAGDLAAAQDCWSTAVEVAHASTLTSDEVTALCGRSTPRLGRGDLPGGLADAEQALHLSLELDLPVVGAMAATVVARARAWRGEHERATQALQQARTLPAAAPFTRVHASAAWAAGVLALTEGRHADALADLQGAAVNAAVALWAGGDLAEPAARSGRPDLVADWSRTAAAAVEANGSPHLAMLLERSRAMLAPADRAQAHFEAALAHGVRSGAAFDLARTRLHYGEWLRRERRITEAREHLTPALEVFDSLGALPLAERVRQELRAAGAESTPVAAEQDVAVRSLTAQELLVARLAAQGLSNKEIADQVYVSHRTVGSHLSHVFAKLQIARRSQLVAALGGEARPA